MTSQTTTEQALDDLVSKQSIVQARPEVDPNKASLLNEYIRLISEQNLSIQLAQEATTRASAAVEE